MRVVVAEDTMLTRAGIVRLLEEHPERVRYLLKEHVFDVAVLVDALRRIDEGECVVDPTIVSRLIGRRRREDPLDELTAREREVLSLVAEGMSNHAIAARLFVTERTVEAHTQSRSSLGSAFPSGASPIAVCSRCSASCALDRRRKMQSP